MGGRQDGWLGEITAAPELSLESAVGRYADDLSWSLDGVSSGVAGIVVLNLGEVPGCQQVRAPL